MNSREILASKALFLEQRDREGVAQRERRGGAGGGREVMRARFLSHPRIECDIGMTSERRLRDTGQRNGANAEALEMLQECHELVRLAALREEDRNIVVADDTEIPVYAVDRVQERRGCSRRRERRRDLASDESRLADAGDDHPSCGRRDELDRPSEAFVETTFNL